tara:strand:- start:44 stop:208 length:165 start_codon:yes stop_codon:yes gene_type:complete
VKFELRLKKNEEAIDVTNSENIDSAKKYFASRKEMTIETFDTLFEVVAKKIKER